MHFQQIFEPKLAQNAYLIGCQRTGEAILVDPMRDILRYIEAAAQANLKITAVTETHIHADYLSGAREFAEQLGSKIYASNCGDDDWRFKWVENSKYDYQLLDHGDTFQVGNIEFKAVFTPGHTPEHMSFLVTDRGGSADRPMGILSGDFVFVGDVGRPDLLESAAGQSGAMKPAAQTLFKALQQFKELPAYLQVWPGHGAGSACGKALGAVPMSTVGYELQFNRSLQAASSEKEFVDYILTGQPEPPMYFARMKNDNRSGPAILGNLPKPKKLGHEQFNLFVNNHDVALVDTRKWQSFRTGHIPGAIFAPMNKSFNTVAGCYVTPDMPIYLIIEEKHLSEAVIDLIRIGLDDVRGYFTPDMLEHFKRSGGELETIAEIDVETLKEKIATNNIQVLDVRRESELAESGHIKNALNIAHTRLHPRLNELPKDQPLMVHCLSGVRSSYASAFLKWNGYDATNVAGGFTAWLKSGGDVVKS